MENTSFVKAQPVWQSGREKELNCICAFFVRFKRSDGAKLSITASSFYKAYLNGRFLAFGPARAAHGYFRVDELPLNDQKEENVLFIEVAGYNTRGYYSLDQSAFLQAEICLDGRPLFWTGRDFAVRGYEERRQKVLRFSFQRTFTEYYDFYRNPADTYTDFNITDEPTSAEIPAVVKGGRLLQRGVSYPLYPSGSAGMTERGTFESVRKKTEENSWLLKKQLKIFPSEEITFTPFGTVAKYVYKKEAPSDRAIGAGEYALFDLEYALTGFIRIELRASSASDVLLVFDELDLNADPDGPADIRFDRNGCVNIIGYNFLNAGKYVHSSFEPYTARYVKVLVRSGEVSDVKISVIAYENPDADAFCFRCSDERLEKIVEAARRTFKQNAVDILTDCPSRERAGWLCDSYFSGRAEQLFTGKNKVEKNFLENYAEMPKLPEVPDGMIPMCYPAEIICEPYIPNWAMWYIVELHDACRRMGDVSIAEKSEKTVRGIIRFLQKYENESGLLEDLDGWVFIEWSRANDRDFIKGVNYPSNMLYALTLERAGELYGNGEWTARAEQVRRAVREQSYNGEFFEDNRVRADGKLRLLGHISETCQYYAFFSKTAAPGLYPGLFRTLVESFGAGRNEAEVYPQVYKSNAFIGNYLRLIMLSENGLKERLSEECVGYFYRMAVKTGTLWENDQPTAGLNHGFASYAANLIVEYMTGFKGRHGKELLFSSAACDMDCELHIPVGDAVLLYERKNGTEHISVPEGYEIKRL